VLVPTTPCARIQEVGRTTRPRLIPSGRPKSLVSPNRRRAGGAAAAKVAVCATAVSGEAPGAAGGALGRAAGSGADRSVGAETVGVYITGGGAGWGAGVGEYTAGGGADWGAGVGEYTAGGGADWGGGVGVYTTGGGAGGEPADGGAGAGVGVYTTGGGAGAGLGGEPAGGAAGAGAGGGAGAGAGGESTGGGAGAGVGVYTTGGGAGNGGGARVSPAASAILPLRSIARLRRVVATFRRGGGRLRLIIGKAYPGPAGFACLKGNRCMIAIATGAF
jgi:hypothetical protein